MPSLLRRRAACITLVVLAGLLLALGGVLLYVRREIADSRAFGARLVSVLDDDAARAVVTRRTVDGVIEGTSGDLQTVRPLALAALDALARSPDLRPVAARSAADAHRALVDGRGSITVRLDPLSPPLLAALHKVSPQLAAQARAHVQPVLVTVPLHNVDLRAARRLLDLAGAAWWIVAAALAAGAGALRLAADRRGALAQLGLAVAGAGALVALAVAFGGSRLSGAAAGAVWDALFGDLRRAALAVLAGGLIVALLAGAVPARRAERRRRALVLAGAVIAGLAALAAAAVIATDAPPSPGGQVPAAQDGGCNGSAALCGRRLNDVVFAGTHNSYAASDEPGWLFANQRHGIARQLDDGIRALLIDVHHGVRDAAAGIVRTPLQAEGSSRNKVAVALGPQGLRAADRIAGRIGVHEPQGTRALYLCHTLCELGAEPLAQELGVIRRFLEAHPRTVLILVVEPYVPPREIEGAFRDAGLLPYVAELDRSVPLPTLGQLIDAGSRLVVFAEEDGGTPPWYMPAFAFIQDTPLDGAGPRRTSCARYRGAADDPILLINHWNTGFPPRPSINARIGTAAALRARVRECEAAGRPAPGIIAVDFYERSAVVAVAAELNAAR